MEVLDALGDADRGPFVLKLSNNERARARAIVIVHVGAQLRDREAVQVRARELNMRSVVLRPDS